MPLPGRRRRSACPGWRSPAAWAGPPAEAPRLPDRPPRPSDSAPASFQDLQKELIRLGRMHVLEPLQDILLQVDVRFLAEYVNQALGIPLVCKVIDDAALHLRVLLGSVEGSHGLAHVLRPV